MDAAGYLAPAAPAEAEVRDRGSRFRARLVPCRDETAAREALAAIAAADADATHHCWAWRLGDPPHERAADAGEPAGTAGYRSSGLAGAGVSDALRRHPLVRGTKLGKGARRAYGFAARGGGRGRLERRADGRFLIEAPFTQLGAVRRLLALPGIELLAESYGEVARLALRVPRARQEELAAALANLGLTLAPANADHERG